MGNVIIGQSGGPTAVINSSLAGAISAAKKGGVPKIYGMHYGIEGFLKKDIIDIEDYLFDIDDLSILKRTPSAFLGSCRYKLPKIEGNEEVYATMFDTLDEYDIEYFMYIGGNDSMDTIKQLSDYAEAHGKKQKFMGIPKTIDNDLPITDHTPGFGSAAKFIATSMREIICDNESFGANDPKICVVEIMGRNAGWLTAASVLSRATDSTGPDLIYLPENPFDEKAFLERVEDLTKKKKSIVIAVSEGLKDAEGKLICEQNDDYAFVDAFGHRQLSGCGKILSNKIARTMGYKTRAIEFSLLQRCATHLASRVDIDEAYDVGYIACEAALAGETGKMVVINVTHREPYVVSYELADIHNIANIEKKMPNEWIINEGTFVSDEFVKYVKPLVVGSLTPYYAGGVPKHISLKNKRRHLN
ncbi:MAG: 6-phosphofructokinase [Lachnospiraceae bacterium]|nr:6-phosphofructokinase [Lachnospiraceae bacterium]